MLALVSINRPMGAKELKVESRLKLASLIIMDRSLSQDSNNE